MALRLEAVGYTYAAGTSFALRALSGVSLCLEPGELALVLGATGSGKSTLLRICAGLLDAEEGTAAIDGAPLSRSSARGSVGLVFQDAESQLFAETLAADVAFGPRNLGATAEEAADRARAALSAVGLDPDAYGERSPFALSGGEARRAAIAGRDRDGAALPAARRTDGRPRCARSRRRTRGRAGHRERVRASQWSATQPRSSSARRTACSFSGPAGRSSRAARATSSPILPRLPPPG